MKINKYDNIVTGLTNFEQRGFSHIYSLEEEGLTDLLTNKVYQTNELNIVELHRFTSSSDRNNHEAIIFALECTDNTKGLIISTNYFDMNGSDLKPGLYYYTVQTKEGKIRGRMLKQ